MFTPQENTAEPIRPGAKFRDEHGVWTVGRFVASDTWEISLDGRTGHVTCVCGRTLHRFYTREN